MSDNHSKSAAPETDAALAPPPDHENQALIDAEHTFVITLIGSALFIGAVYVFIL